MSQAPALKRQVYFIALVHIHDCPGATYTTLPAMKMKVGFCSLWLLVSITNLWSQPIMDWHNVDSVFRPLPNSMDVYATTTPVDGKPNRAFYVVAELKDKSLDFTTQVGNGKRFTPQQYFQQEGNPTVVVNGTFFSFADNRNLNLVIREGKMKAYNISTAPKGKDSTQFYYITRSAIGISPKRKADVAWIHSDTIARRPMALQNAPFVGTGTNPSPKWNDLEKMGIDGRKWKMRTAIGGGPTLVVEGSKHLFNTEERMFVNGENDRHPRTAMGYTKDGKLVILVVEGRNPGIAEGASLHHLAEMLVQLNCYEALNLDGGGSSCLLINGKETIKPSDKEGERPVPAVFMIYAQK